MIVFPNTGGTIIGGEAGSNAMTGAGVTGGSGPEAHGPETFANAPTLAGQHARIETLEARTTKAETENSRLVVRVSTLEDAVANLVKRLEQK